MGIGPTAVAVVLLLELSPAALPGASAANLSPPVATVSYCAQLLSAEPVDVPMWLAGHPSA